MPVPRMQREDNQEQIAASHEFDGVRKEKERLTAASLNNRFFIFLEVVSISSSLASTSSDDESKVCYNSLASLFVTPIKKETERELKKRKKLWRTAYNLLTVHQEKDRKVEEKQESERKVEEVRNRSREL